MAKEMRLMVASDDISGLIDHGAEVDNQIKNLTFEDKGIKTKLTDVIAPQIQEGESSVRVKAKVSAAVITVVERVDVDFCSPAYPKVKEAIENGILEGVVERKLSLVVPPLDLVKAAEILKKAGIKATVSESISVKADDLRKEALTEDLKQAIEWLKQCVKKDTTYRVKYEKAKE